MIPLQIIIEAANILGNTEKGLTGRQIAEQCVKYAIRFNITIPYPEYPFPPEIGNKRSALRENLKSFKPNQQYKIIMDLCENEKFKDNDSAINLKDKLAAYFYDHNNLVLSEEVNEVLIEEAINWLADYPEVLKLFNEAFSKYKAKVHLRNLLDDLRLSLEKLLQNINGNRKPLEKQSQEIGFFLNQKGTSLELNQMFVKLVDYYSTYQNRFVKHDDAVMENEIEFIFELTASFMKLLIRLK